MSTPHINAKKGDFAETVLFPGDPLRAKFIAENFLQNAKEVTNVRNMLGFTGEYNGKRVSVMGSGMGIPSCSIYAKELITEYGVKNLMRIGSAGALSKDVKVRDIVIAMGASTDSGVNRQRFGGFDYAAIASFNMVKAAYDAAQKQNIAVKVGNCFSADLFYTPLPQMFDTMEKMNILCVEMEAAGLYGVAAEYGANALAILTISDHIRTHEALSAEDRQNSFKEMMKVALETAFVL
jgi:purine-nucleoside phosphorylase